MKLELAPPSDKKMLMRDAILYCLTHSRDGHKDWRMLTGKEMLDLSLQGFNYHHGTWAYPEHNADNIDDSIFYNNVKARVIPVRDI